MKIGEWALKPVKCAHGTFVIGELPVRSSRLALALERADEGERMIGAARGPGAAAVARAAQPERDVFSDISKAGEVRGGSVGTERHCRIASEVIRARPRHGGIVRELRDPGDESTRQRRRPRLAAVERRVDAAAVVVVPVVVAGDHVARVRRINGERGLVLSSGVAADVDDRYRARAEGAEAWRAEGGDGGFAAGGNEDDRGKDRSVTHRVLQRGVRGLE